jgi:hypothetical protein
MEPARRPEGCQPVPLQNDGLRIPLARHDRNALPTLAPESHFRCKPRAMLRTKLDADQPGAACAPSMSVSA